MARSILYILIAILLFVIIRNLTCKPPLVETISPNPPPKERKFLHSGVSAFPGTVSRQVIPSLPTRKKNTINGFNTIHTVDPRHTIYPSRESNSLTIVSPSFSL